MIYGSTSEPWRQEPARTIQHASYHSVLGSERSQPMRSRPAQLATCQVLKDLEELNLEGL